MARMLETTKKHPELDLLLEAINIKRGSWKATKEEIDAQKESWARQIKD